MKNKLFYLLLCTNLLLFSEAKAQEGMQPSIITGNISDYNLQRDGEMAEVIFDDLLEIRVNSIIPIDSTGNFSFQVTRPHSQTGMFIFGENLYSFYIAPGDSQHFEIKSTIATTAFTGDHAKFNTNLNSYYKLINSFGDDYDIQDSLRCALPIDEYQAYIAKNNDVVNSAVDAFLEESKAGNEFKSWSISQRKYSSMANSMKYRWLKPIQCKLNADSFKLTIPSSYLSFLNEPNLIEKNSFGSQSFYYFFTDYYNYLYYEAINPDSSKKAIELFKNGNKLASFLLRARHFQKQGSDFTGDLLLARYYYDILGLGNLEEFNIMFSDRPIKEEKLSNLLRVKYEHLKQLKENQNETGTIHFPEEIRESESNIIGEISKRFQNKILYIDFWAPWCKPCMEQVPHAKELKKNIDSNLVVFVYLGVQCDKEWWETTIQQKQMEGEHYLLTNKQYARLKKEFNITGIPHYLIVDQSGQIVKNNAEKPREKNQLLTIFEELGNKTK